jgi:DNA-binding MarR family transcriptional regulator
MERRVSQLFTRKGIHDLTPAQANVLVILFHKKEPTNARTLARELAVSEVTMARFIRALESSGWIGRERSSKDARTMLIRLRKKAYSALPTLADVANGMMDEAFEGFDRTSTEQFANFSARIVENMKRTAHTDSS